MSKNLEFDFSEKFKFIDLFAGIGGFRLAMQNVGGKCVFTSEWDKDAKRTYKANFGERPFGDITKEETKELEKIVSNLENRTIKCPECASVMADLGKDFKAPKKTAVKEWKIVESLFKTGKCFHSCGCDGIGYIPKNPKDYEVYLNTILKTYQEYLAACQNAPLQECPEKTEEIKYWSGNIQKIKTEIIDNKFEIM